MASDTEAKEQHKADQAYVRKSIAAACVVYACIMTTAYYAPIPKPHLPTAVDRLAYTLRWQMISALVLFAGIMGSQYPLAHRRHWSTEQGSRKVRGPAVAVPAEHSRAVCLEFRGKLNPEYVSLRRNHARDARSGDYVCCRSCGVWRGIFSVSASKIFWFRSHGLSDNVCVSLLCVLLSRLRICISCLTPSSSSTIPRPWCKSTGY